MGGDYSALYADVSELAEGFEKGNAKHRNSPVDCFGARVRAGERESEPGERFICAKKRTSTFVLVLFF